MYKGNFAEWGSELDRILSFFNSDYIDDSGVVKYISSIRGNFSIIIITSLRKIISVDHIRSIPMYYLINDKSIIVTDDTDFLQKQLNKRNYISEFSKLQVLMSGYTLFDDTLYAGIKSFIPGQLFIHNITSTSVHNINNYRAWFEVKNKNIESLDYYQSRFNDVMLEVMSETIDSLNCRQVVIPLSGGYDSRLIASLLRHYNYENVICFTYGMVNNFEALAAEDLAKSLDYKWFFIDLNIRDQINFYKSDDFFSYLEFADTADSVSYYQGLYSVKYLKENKLIDKDAVFINGNSGDFITGGHMSKMYQFCDQKYLDRNIFEVMINKHYSLWGHIKTKTNIKRVTDRINDKYKYLKNLYGFDINACDFVYYYEFMNRQSKYVIQGQKVFEYYGYDWRMPLWDSKLIEFWSIVPNNYKNEQMLYKSTLLKYNYSNVWREGSKINNYIISSTLIRNTRRFLKLIVTILTGGNDKIWDRIDRVFFYYFYDITRMSCSVSYWRAVASFFKQPRHNVSFDAEKYISFHEKSS